MAGVAGVLAGGTATGGIVYLAAFAPRRAKRRFERLAAELPSDREALIRHYRRAVIGGIVSAAVALAIAALAATAGFDVGLGPPRNALQARIIVIEFGILIPLSVVVFHAAPRLYRRLVQRTIGRAALILPASGRERWVFAAVAVTAGVWEEIVFRGFAMGYLRWVWPGAGDGAAVVITAALFGAAHLYQGRRGMAMTGLAGLLFGALALWSGGLSAPIFAHALIDLRLCLLPTLPPPAMGSDPSTVEVAAPIGLDS